MLPMRRWVGWLGVVALAVGCTTALVPRDPAGGTDGAVDRPRGSTGGAVVDAAREIGRGGVSVTDAAPDLGFVGRPDPSPLGLACRSASDCLTGFCVDGVCCDSACAGPCLTCAALGALGTCVARDVGTGPRTANDCLVSSPATCGLNGLCDGVGGCERYVPGTLCAQASCLDSMTVRQASICDGLGACVAGAINLCAPYTCTDGACYADDCQFTPGDCLPPGKRDASSD